MADDKNENMGRRSFLKSFGKAAAVTAIAPSVLLQACSKENDIAPTPEKPPGGGTPAVTQSEITIGNIGVYYNTLENLGGALGAAQQDTHVIMQPGKLAGTDIEKAGAKAASSNINAVGYLSGISLNLDDAALGPLRTKMDAIGGWLKDNNNKRLYSTYSDRSPLVDLRKPEVARLMAEYGIRVGQSFPKGAIIDEADQAIYMEETYGLTGLTQAFAQTHNDIASGTYYGYGVDQMYDVAADGKVVRHDKIEIVGDPGSKKAKSTVTGKILNENPSYHTTDILSGIQPSSSNLANIIARYAGASGCSLTLESRVYLTAGQKTDDAYRKIVEGQILQMAEAAKGAGRTGITINALEPAVRNQGTDGNIAGYEEAAKETHAWYSGVMARVEAKTGLKIRVNMDIVRTVDPGKEGAGFFDFATTGDFAINDTLKTRLQSQNIKVSNVQTDGAELKPVMNHIERQDLQRLSVNAKMNVNIGESYIQR